MIKLLSLFSRCVFLFVSCFIVNDAHSTIREIVTFPAPVLLQEAEDVVSVDENIKKILDDMTETMYSNNGVGLAAPQIGISKKLVVIDMKRK